MYSANDLLEELKDIKASIGHEKEWEKLRDRIFSCATLSEDQILELDNDVKDFFKSKAPKEDKKQLMEYTESLNIMVAWIFDKRAEGERNG